MTSENVEERFLLPRFGGDEEDGIYNGEVEGSQARARARASPEGVGEEDDIGEYAAEGLKRLKRMMGWAGLFDPTHKSNSTCGWIIFTVLGVMVPVLDLFRLSCHGCQSEQIQIDIIIQLSESSLALISFLFLRSHNLHDMFITRSNSFKEPLGLRQAFHEQMQTAYRLLGIILIPCFAFKTMYECWWLTKKPFGTTYHVIMMVAILLAWFYRMILFLFICVLFRLVCSMMLIYFDNFEEQFADKFIDECETMPILPILDKHISIQKKLFNVSHRYRVFIISSFITITVSQIVSLFIATASSQDMDIIKAGNLIVCAIVQVTGFALCLHGAARITHRAQSTVSKVSIWHARVTCISNEGTVSQIRSLNTSCFIDPNRMYPSSTDTLKDSESSSDIPSIGTTDCKQASFQKRQALVSYLRHTNAGISVYGFVLDRGFIYTLFGLELSVVLFTLSLTIAIN